MELEDFETEQERVAFISAKLEEFKAVISLAQTALKIPILINGGAAIAILALMGNTWSENSLTTDIAESLLFFSIGVLMAAIGSGAAYLAQLIFLRVRGTEDKATEDKANKWQCTAIICVIISYILFMVGAWWAYDTFSTLKPP
jgi:uncharacterized membrane protein YidH (DUF202 family)